MFKTNIKILPMKNFFCPSELKYTKGFRLFHNSSRKIHIKYESCSNTLIKRINDIVIDFWIIFKTAIKYEMKVACKTSFFL